MTDISNHEQLGLVLRYLKNGQPIERLIEYIECESITGEALCDDIKNTLLRLTLRLEDTVSQTYDGAANFSGHVKGCASRFQETVPHAQYICHICHFESKDIPTQMTKQSFTIIYFITFKKTIHFKLICKNVHS